MNTLIIKQLGGKNILKREIRNDQDLLDAVKSGIPSLAIDYWIKDKKISKASIAQFLGITPKTLERTKNKTLAQREGDAFIQLVDLFAFGEEVLSTKESFQKWINIENAALALKKPIELFNTSLGREAVKAVLGRIEFGIYS